MEVFSMNILAGRQRAVERNCTIYTSNKEVFLFPTSLSTFDIFELFLKISSHCFFFSYLGLFVFLSSTSTT